MTRSHAVETLARTTHFVFDKTGTLTFGRPALLEVLPLGRLDGAACMALVMAGSSFGTTTPNGAISVTSPMAEIVPPVLETA